MPDLGCSWCIQDTSDPCTPHAVRAICALKLKDFLAPLELQLQILKKYSFPLSPNALGSTQSSILKLCDGTCGDSTSLSVNQKVCS